ncbi:hypothetical protein COCON_G00159860 [Conger conger]|uniref:Uncharacterized protein n=1 Tax=Conger conger TaxID=82655 RepID=A0A9Q1HUN4_CONCO|nr:hypothetical protein COCON_G00159860 [Conger conger]
MLQRNEQTYLSNSESQVAEGEALARHTCRSLLLMRAVILTHLPFPPRRGIPAWGASPGPGQTPADGSSPGKAGLIVMNDWVLEPFLSCSCQLCYLW